MPSFMELQNRVQAAVIDVPQAVRLAIPELINDAIRMLQDQHNFKVMEATAGPLVTTVGSGEIGLSPANFKEFRDKPYHVDNTGKVWDMTKAASREAALDAFHLDPAVDIGRPLVLVDGSPAAEIGGDPNLSGRRVWEVFPFPDGASDWNDGEYRIYVPYWAYIPKLVAPDDRNWFTENAWMFIVYQAAAEAFDMEHDYTSADRWRGKASEQFQRVINADKRMWVSNMRTLVPHKGVNTPKLEM